ncbi:hypothetical protein SDC9_184062 [bioreactor metagenome]|uniref:Uncharacterized protein n=1 Tax=bioreactor metagenome TaxID=1076179 RepID=A0A645HLP6_9ZZZZ
MNRRRKALFDHHALQRLECGFHVAFNRDFEHFLALAAVNRQHAVARHLAHRFGEITVHGVNALRRLRVVRNRTQAGRALQKRAQRTAHRRVVRDHFGDDVLCARDGILDGFNALFGVDKGGGQHIGQCGARLLKEFKRQRLQTLFLRHHGAGAALFLVGQVEVFKRCQRFGVGNGRGQFVG